jgi:hypothetical protein
MGIRKTHCKRGHERTPENVNKIGACLKCKAATRTGDTKCVHGRQACRCRECGGNQFCEHGRRRDRCKECGGSQICEHGIDRSQCKNCDGGAICEHNVRKARCRDCHGNGLCEHNRDRGFCRYCGISDRNREMTRASRQRRRARKLDGGESFTTWEWQTLKRQYGYRCVGCWETEEELKTIDRTLSPDHIIALTMGGLDHITNIQPLCHGKGGCNNSKGAKYIDFCTS